VRGVATNRRLSRTYGASLKTPQLRCGGSKRLRAANLTAVHDLLVGVAAPIASQVASLILATALT